MPIDRSPFPALRATMTRAAALVGCAGAASAASLPPGFVRLADVAPAIAQDMRYAGVDNFTGRPVPGYRAAQCWLRAEAAEALARAQADARAHGLDLIVYDCYRPRRAVAAFLAWSQRAEDGLTKERYYPAESKSDLFARGYIAEKSSHSTGLAVDLAIKGLDFGAPFDFFDEKSSTAYAAIPQAARANRRLLDELMRANGFVNYPREWWHFALESAANAPSYDVEIE